VINLSDTKATIEVTFSVQLNLGEWRYPTAVKAIKSSALDFIQKPFCAEEIVRQLENVLKRFRAPEKQGFRNKTVAIQFSGTGAFDPQRDDVLEIIASGLSSKEAALARGIGE